MAGRLNPLEKLRSFLDNMEEPPMIKGGYSRNQYPLNTFHILLIVYSDLKRGKRTWFIQREVKDILEKCGFQVSPDENGWEAYSD